MRDALPTWHLSGIVHALQAMRGVQLIAAMTLVAELQDFLRFDSPRQLMAYVGLLPSEHSSEPKRRQGSIIKAGYSAARRMLVEITWLSARVNSPGSSGPSGKKSSVLAQHRTDLVQPCRWKEARSTTRSPAGSGTRRSRGHWGVLDNVIGGPGRRQRLATAISVPRAKAAPRRTLVLRYPTLAYQHEQPSHIHLGWQPLAPSRSPSGNRSKLHLNLQRKALALLTERSHINV